MASLLSSHGLSDSPDNDTMLPTHLDHVDAMDGQPAADENHEPLSHLGLRMINIDNLRDNAKPRNGKLTPCMDLQACAACGKIVANIKKHMKSHNPDQHKCPYCSLVLTRADNLKRHVRMKHRESKAHFDKTVAFNLTACADSDN